jgi:hypothetical protein
VTRFAAAAAATLFLAVPAFAESPTDEEALAWAKKVEETVRAHDPSFLDQSLDYDEMGARAFAGLSVKDKTRTDFVAGMKAGGSFGKGIVASLGEKGTWKLVRVLKRGDERVAVFRAVMEVGGWTYQELSIGKKGERTCFYDLVNHGTAVRLSTFMRQMALSLAVMEDKDLSSRLKGAEVELAKHIDDLQTLNKLNRAQKWQEAYDTCKKLPEALRTSRMILLVQLQTAKNLGPEEYKATLFECRKVLGKDPAIAILSFDRYLQDQDWTQALAALDVVDKAVGGDAFLDYQRCEVHYKAGALDEAKKAGERAIEKEPELESAQWALVTIALKTKDWKGARAGLERLEKQGVKLNDLTKVPVFSEFVKTDEYAAWVKGHSEKK